MWNRVWIKNFSKNSKVFGTSTLDVYVLTYLWMHTPHPPNVGGGAQQADKNVKNDGKSLKMTKMTKLTKRDTVIREFKEVENDENVQKDTYFDPSTKRIWNFT